MYNNSGLTFSVPVKMTLMTLGGMCYLVLSTVLSEAGVQVSVSYLQNIFVTGGSSQVKGFEDRLHSEVMAMRPFQSEFRVWSAGELVWGVEC